MTFVWIVGNFSKWNHNELRYSIRSVLKFHPDADIWVCGYKPSWYKGNHIPVADPDKCPYINVWNKIETVCRHPDIPDIFVQMDDDFFLMQPVEVKHYYKGEIVKMYNKYKNHGMRWAKAVCASYHKNPQAKDHCLHVPLVINKANFMRIAEQHPDRLAEPSLVPRQVYCSNETAFGSEYRKDFKLINGFVKGAIEKITAVQPPVFSTDDYFRSSKFKAFLDTLYPEKSIFEIELN